MSAVEEQSTVVIVGAGVSGLTLGNFLLRKGIDCVVLERRSREYVEQRQRAGVIDTRAVRMFREWGLEERVVGGVPIELTMNFRLDGEVRPLAFGSEDHGDGRFCPQQVLVKNLMNVFDEDGGDLRFEVEVTALEDLTGENPVVRYKDADGSEKAIACEFVAGCDGDRGFTRTTIPDDQITLYSHEYGYAWLTVMAEVPAKQQSIMSLHPSGFAAQFPRGPQASRSYLQVPLDTDKDAWGDERIWNELEARFEEGVDRGPIVDTQLVPLRSTVYEPMSYGRLYLLGDSAHIIPPMSAKGMNLALHDAEAFAGAVLHYKNDAGDTSLLESYSETCLRHIWDYQAFAAWFTDMVHNSGDPSLQGEFRHKIGRADLKRLYESEAANRLFSDFITGLN